MMMSTTRTLLFLLGLPLFCLVTSGHTLAVQTDDPSDNVTAQTNPADQTNLADQADLAEQAPPDWAADFLADDPLAAKESITLEDLEWALAGQRQRQTVIERHFRRANLTAQQQRQFLASSLEHADMTVRRQAAEALHQVGELKQVVQTRLLEWIRTGDQQAVESAIVGLQFLPIPQEQLDRDLLDALLRALASESVPVRRAAARQLESLGPAAIPLLLQAMQDPDQPRQAAAEILSRIIGEVRADKEIRKPVAPPKEVTKSAPRAEASELPARDIDQSQAEVVRVYYGTNRAISQNPTSPSQTLAIWGMVLLATLLYVVWSSMRPRPNGSSRLRWVTRRLLTAVLLFCLAVFSAMQCDAALRQLTASRTGVQFGGRRSTDSKIYYGYCDVSIPPTHAVGVVERPLVGPEDESQHVVLRRVALLDEAGL